MQLNVTGEKIENLLYWENKPVLELKISFPQLLGPLSKESEYRFNRYYRTLAMRWNSRGRTVMFRRACEEAKVAKTMEYDFELHSFIRAFSVPRLEERYCSVITDQYQFLGGTHGLTVRNADLWDFRLNRKIAISGLFQSFATFKRILLQQVFQKIKLQMEKEEILFFENPLRNAVEFFREKNCYLTEDSIAVFYPLYTLAPYYAGILTYYVPFSVFEGCWIKNRAPNIASKNFGSDLAPFTDGLL